MISTDCGLRWPRARITGRVRVRHAAGRTRRRTGRTRRARRAGPGAPSGWYWTVSIGSSAWRRPSTERSLRLTWLTRKPDAAGSESPTTWTSWFWAVTWTSPCRGPGPGGSRRGGRTGAGVVSAPAARPTIWWPRQIPSSGRPSSMTARASATGPSSRAGSPGPGREHDAGDVGREHVAPRSPCAAGRGPARRAAAGSDDVRLEAEVDDRRRAARPARRRPRRPRPARPGRRSPGPPSAARLGARDGRRVGPSSPGPVMMPRRLPFARRCRARARVSTPAIAGMPSSRRSGASWRASSRTAAVAFATTRPRSHGPRRLVVVREPAVVADQRIGHDDDLAGVRGVGADLLVAGLARVDDEVAAGGDRRAERDARGRPCRPRAPAAPGRGRRSGGRRRRVGARQRRMGRRSVGRSLRTQEPRRWLGRGARPRDGMRMRDLAPPTRPHRTGTPALRTGDQRWPRAYHASRARERPVGAPSRRRPRGLGRRRGANAGPPSAGSSTRNNAPPPGSR